MASLDVYTAATIALLGSCTGTVLGALGGWFVAKKAAAVNDKLAREREERNRQVARLEKRYEREVRAQQAFHAVLRRVPNVPLGDPAVEELRDLLDVFGIETRRSIVNAFTGVLAGPFQWSPDADAGPHPADTLIAARRVIADAVEATRTELGLPERPDLAEAIAELAKSEPALKRAKKS